MIENVTTLLIELGELLIAWRKEKNLFHKVIGDQLKSEVDQRAHDFLVKGLAKIAPEIKVLSEEDGEFDNTQRPDCYWLIDPLDGTKSYVNEYKGYVTQLSLIKEGQPLMAVVYQPHTGDLYQAKRGDGATLNGKPISVTQTSRQWVLTDNMPKPTGIAAKVYSKINCSSYIESGSLGLKVCLVASGTADVFVKDVFVRDWDIAPAHLILSESGGSLVQGNGKPYIYSGNWQKTGLIAACNQELLHEIIQECDILNSGVNHYDKIS